MTMESSSGFSASVASGPTGDDGETAWEVRQDGERFAGLFVDTVGATLAWPGIGIDFSRIEQYALPEISQLMSIRQPRVEAGGEADEAGVAAWLVTQDGGTGSLFSNQGATLAGYRSMLNESDQLTFARFDVARPPAFQVLEYAFTAQRQSPDSIQQALALRLTEAYRWTPQLLAWILDHHVRADSVQGGAYVV